VEGLGAGGTHVVAVHLEQADDGHQLVIGEALNLLVLVSHGCHIGM